MGRLFFDSAGRMGRARFLAAMAVVVALFAAFEAAVRGSAHAFSAWLVHLVLVFSAACLLSKRLHDRGWSGWWSFVPLAAFGLAWPRPTGALGWAGLVLVIASAIELGLKRGQTGFNRYGAPG